MKTWNDIFGQEAAIGAIRSAYMAERLPHGLIFAGPIGVGKATTAALLGKLFLCEHPNGDQPCGQCQSCRLMESQTHPDFRVITKELIRYHDKTGKSKGIDLSIHVIRGELLAPAAMKPAMDRGRVFVIEQAELMTRDAQNAMLKTLEEPAGRTLIILLTDQPDVLLPTIRSRTRMIHFSPLKRETVIAQLTARKIAIDLAARAADLSRGSLGLSLRWIEDGVIEPASELCAQLDAMLVGQAAGDLPAWFKQSAEAYAERQLGRDALASKDQASREGLALYLAIAAEHLRRKLTEPGQDLERLCDMIESIAQTEKYLDANVNVSLALQQLTGKLMLV